MSEFTLSEKETAQSLFTRWKTLSKNDRRSLTCAIKRNVKNGLYEEKILTDFKELIEKYQKDLLHIKSTTTPKVTKAKSVNKIESNELNDYLLQLINNNFKRGFSDPDVRDLFIIKKPDGETEEKSITRFSTNFWIRLNRILGTELPNGRSWKQKYSYRLALETLKRNNSTVQYFFAHDIKDMSHLENIFLKIIKDNCAITLDQMKMEAQKRKREEQIRQKERQEEETQEEILAKFQRQQDNLPPEKECWFEDLL